MACYFVYFNFIIIVVVDSCVFVVFSREIYKDDNDETMMKFIKAMNKKRYLDNNEVFV